MRASTHDTPHSHPPPVPLQFPFFFLSLKLPNPKGTVASASQCPIRCFPPKVLTAVVEGGCWGFQWSGYGSERPPVCIQACGPQCLQSPTQRGIDTNGVTIQ